MAAISFSSGDCGEVSASNSGVDLTMIMHRMSFSFVLNVRAGDREVHKPAAFNTTTNEALQNRQTLPKKTSCYFFRLCSGKTGAERPNLNACPLCRRTP